jgi:RNA 2',3'-cyclic 3'-phosphodiesterase
MTRGGGATARLFVAVELPAAVREALGTWGRGAAREISAHAPAKARVGEPARPTRLATRRGGPPLRLLEPEALHLTMCFLGNRPMGEIEAIEAAMDSCVGWIGEVSLGAPLWLPPGRPRTLAVEVHHDGRLAELQGELVGALAGACGFEPERRRFRPHITVARMRAGAAPGGRRLPATPALTFAPEALVLYRSWLSPKGASYEALARRSR